MVIDDDISQLESWGTFSQDRYAQFQRTVLEKREKLPKNLKSGLLLTKFLK